MSTVSFPNGVSVKTDRASDFESKTVFNTHRLLADCGIDVSEIRKNVVMRALEDPNSEISKIVAANELEACRLIYTTKDRSLHIPYALNNQDQALLSTTYSELSLTYGKVNHGHGLAASMSLCEHSRLLQFIGYDPQKVDKTNSFEVYFKEIGGKFHKNFRRGVVNCHSCEPTLSHSDHFRRVDDQIFRQNDPGYADFMRVNGEHVLCHRRAQECDIKAKFLLAHHSVYDVTIEQFCLAMDAASADVGYATFWFPKQALFQKSGRIEHAKLLWKITPDWRISFAFDDGAAGYNHDFKELVRWLFVKGITVNGQRYLLDVIDERLGVFFVKIIRCTALTVDDAFREEIKETLPFSIRLFPKNYKVIYFLKYDPSHKATHWIGKESLRSARKAMVEKWIAMPAEFWERLTAHGMNQKEGQFIIASLQVYASSVNQARLLSAGMLWSAHDKMDTETLVDAVMAAYIWCYNKRNEQSTGVNRFIALEQNFRRFIDSGKLRRMWLQLLAKLPLTGALVDERTVDESLQMFLRNDMSVDDLLGRLVLSVAANYTPHVVDADFIMMSDVVTSFTHPKPGVVPQFDLVNAFSGEVGNINDTLEEIRKLAFEIKAEMTVQPGIERNMVTTQSPVHNPEPVDELKVRCRAQLKKVPITPDGECGYESLRRLFHPDLSLADFKAFLVAQFPSIAPTVQTDWCNGKVIEAVCGFHGASLCIHDESGEVKFTSVIGSGKLRGHLLFSGTYDCGHIDILEEVPLVQVDSELDMEFSRADVNKLRSDLFLQGYVPTKPSTQGYRDRCAAKMSEMLACLPQDLGDVLDLCSAPGGFALTYQSLAKSVTLVSHPGDDKHPRFYTDLEGRKIYADVMQPLPLPDAAFDFVVADGAVDAGTDYTDQSHINSPLITREIDLIRKHLKPGGAALIKLFACDDTATIEQVVVFCKSFESWGFIKPNSSSPANDERYLYATGFRGLLTSVVTEADRTGLSRLMRHFDTKIYRFLLADEKPKSWWKKWTGFGGYVGGALTDDSVEWHKYQGVEVGIEADPAETGWRLVARKERWDRLRQVLRRGWKIFKKVEKIDGTRARWFHFESPKPVTIENDCYRFRPHNQMANLIGKVDEPVLVSKSETVSPLVPTAPPLEEEREVTVPYTGLFVEKTLSSRAHKKVEELYPSDSEAMKHQLNAALEYRQLLIARNKLMLSECETQWKLINFQALPMLISKENKFARDTFVAALGKFRLVEKPEKDVLDVFTGEKVDAMYVYNGVDIVSTSANTVWPALTHENLLINPDFKILSAIANAQIRFPTARFSSVEGVPGCGKTTDIVSRYVHGADLVLTSTREGAKDVKAKLLAKKIKDPKVCTIDSFFMNQLRLPSRAKYQKVLVDEYLMKHSGMLAWLNQVIDADEILCFGDVKQIPYIERVQPLQTHLKYETPKDFLKPSEFRSKTYRCPKDVTQWMKTIYCCDVTTGNPVNFSMARANFISVSTIDYQKSTVLTFTQSDKQAILTHLRNNKFENGVMTINEAQGQTFRNVILVRTAELRENPIFSNEAQILVGLTRHTESFVYYTPDPNDAISQIIAKYSMRVGGRAQTAEESLQSLVQPADEIYAYESEMFDLTNCYGLENAWNARTPIMRMNIHFEDRINSMIDADPGLIQAFYDELVPGVSQYDRSLDAQMNAENDIVIGRMTGKFVDGYNRFQPRDDRYLIPLVKTSMLPPRTRCIEEEIAALNKRNLDVPNMDDAGAQYHVLEEMKTKFFDAYIDRAKFKEVAATRIGVSAMTITDWKNGQKNSKDILSSLDLTKSLGEMDLNTYEFSIKTTSKPSMEAKDVFQYPALQTIAAHPKIVNALFCPVIKVMKEKLQFCLNDRTILNMDLSPAEFAKKMTLMFPPGYAENFKSLEIDIAKYDKSQGLLALLWDVHMMRLFNVDDPLIQLWWIAHVKTCLKSYQSKFSVYLDFQRKSGDALTLKGNTTYAMAMIAVAFDMRKVKFAAFVGDDSVLWGLEGMEYRDSIRFFEKVFNLTVKIFKFEHVLFCSKFLVPYDDVWVFYPDPVKLLTKLGRHDARNYSHLEDYRKSILDLIGCYDNVGVHFRIAQAVSERYKANVDITFFLGALTNLFRKRRGLETLFSEPKGVKLMTGSFSLLK